MTTALELDRRSLRTVLRDELSRRIGYGAIAPGARLNETDLARELGVSATPIREALLSLEGELGIVSEPRRGFRVQPLERKEAEELYSLVGHLERHALTLQGIPPRECLTALAKVNARLGAARTTLTQALALDDEWHSLLLARQPNGHLVDVTRRLKRLLRRYEYAYMLSGRRITLAQAQHDAIVDELTAGHLVAAGKLLEQNWLAGIGPMCDWLSTPADRRSGAPARPSRKVRP